MLFSCANPDAVVQALGSDDTLSGIIADSVVFYRSDSGRVNLELHTPRMVRIESEDELMEFPLGFDVYMYDKGEKTTESKKAQPKPMRRCEPIKPTMAANKEPVSNPKISANNDIMLIFCRKDN